MSKDIFVVVEQRGGAIQKVSMELIGEAERYQKERRQRVERQFIGAKEVAEILGVSESKAYSVIRDLNKELKERGFITVAGKVSRVFFQERVYGVKTG